MQRITLIGLFLVLITCLFSCKKDDKKDEEVTLTNYLELDGTRYELSQGFIHFPYGGEVL